MTAFRTLPAPKNDRRSRIGSAGVATLIHLGVVALFLVIRAPIVQRAGPDGWAFGSEPGDASDAGSGGAGGDLMIQLPPPPAGDASPDLPAIPDLVAPVVPDLETIVVPDLEVPPPNDFIQRPVMDCNGPCRGIGLADGAGGGTGGGSGPGTGPGVGPATGSGSGSGSGGGGTAIRPPAPLTILVPPKATSAVRGKAATVLLQVDSLGAVRDAAVVLSSGDKGYDQQLRRVALGWKFRPARDPANRPIAYPFQVSLKF